MILTRTGRRGIRLHISFYYSFFQGDPDRVAFLVKTMASIIRATTPTIKYVFKTVRVEDITAAYMTIKMEESVLIEKDLTEATVSEDAITWTLTQQETLAMTADKVTIMLNWKLNDGTRGASVRTALFVEDNDKEEVI